jgi:WD40 repeat protein
MSDVFISYSRRDIAFARLIREALQQGGIDTWIDWDRIPVGERWWQEITGAIQGANTFMLIISRHSIGSKVCRDEIDQALENHKRIVPVLVDRLTPEEIAGLAPDLPQFNWVVFERDKIFRLEADPNASSDKPEDLEVALATMPQFEEALRKLSVAIHTDWEWVKYHTQLQVEALRWDKNQRDASYVVRGTALEEAEQQLFRAAGRDPQPTSLQVEYVTASRQEEARSQQEKLGLERKARRRQRYVLAAVAIGLLVASSLGVVAWGQRNQYLDEANARATAQAQTEQQRQVAVQQRQVAVDQRNIAVSRQLAAQAINHLDGKDVGTSLLLAMEAYHHAPTMDARSSLLRLILTEPRLRYSIIRHTDAVHGVAISPDGTIVASASADMTIGLWSTATGEAIHAPLTGHTKGVMAVAFSPDGRYLVSGGDDGQVILWDVNGGFSSTVIFTGDSWVWNVAFSPDGKYLTVSFMNDLIAVLSMADKQVVCPMSASTGDSTDFFPSLTFAPDSRTLAVGNEHATSSTALVIWDVSTCKRIGAPIDLSPLAKMSETDGNDVWSLAFSPDGKQLSLGIGDSLLVIDPATRKTLRDAVVLHTNYPINSMAYSPDSSLIALGLGDKTIVLLNAATGAAVGQPMIGGRGSVASVAFGRNGHTLASGDWNANVLIWDLQNQPLSRSLTGAAPAFADLAFSPTGKVLALANSDQTIQLWDTGAWQPIGQPIEAQDQRTHVLVFSPDGKVLATGGADNLVHLWDATTGKPIGGALTAASIVECLSFSPDGKWLAAAGADDRLAVWNATTREEVLARQYAPPLSADPFDIDIDKEIASVGFSPDSSTLYFSKGSGLTFFLPVADVSSGSDSGTRQIKWTMGSSMNQILSAMSPDGKTIALANTMDIRMYDVSTLQTIGLPMYGHTDSITSLAFTPDGKLLASGSQDGTVRLWDPATGQAVGSPLTGPAKWVERLDISPDGKWVAAVSADGKTYVWDLSQADWESLACGVVLRNLYGPEWQQFLPDEAFKPTCPNQPIDGSAMTQAADLAHARQAAGQADEAKAIIQQELDTVVATKDDGPNNTLCWLGSVDGFATLVMPACERAVAVAPADRVAGERDSRGLARALTGNTAGAIEDFQAFVDWSKSHDLYDSMGKEREGWIASLRQGKNPFDQKTLDSLRT